MPTSTKRMNVRGKPGDVPPIELLIDALASDDIGSRREALRALIQRGTVVLNSLVGLLKSRNEHIRWEATKALGKIGGHESAEALVGALDDESLDVRWLAANGLIAMGEDALVPLLHGLIMHPDSIFVREASSHVLHTLLDQPHADVVIPVLSALDAGMPMEEVPVAAHEALNKLRDGARMRLS